MVGRVKGDPRKASDDELMRRVAAADEEALAESYRRFGALVHTIALRSVGGHHDAEDITQQVFVALWKGRESLDPASGSLAGWLTVVTRRRCADHHAARSRRTRDEHVLAREAERSVPDPADAADRVLIADELAALGDPRATIIRMAILEDRRQADIADELELPLGTVKSHVRRGLIHLRSRLEEVTS